MSKEPSAPSLVFWQIQPPTEEEEDPICSIGVGSFRRSIKACLMKIQNMYDQLEWCDKNFELETAVQTKVQEMSNNNYNFSFLS